MRFSINRGIKWDAAALILIMMICIAGCSGLGGGAGSASSYDKASNANSGSTASGRDVTGSSSAASKDASTLQGGFSSTVPAGGSTPPHTIYKTDSYKGPMQTNDWWSSVAWVQYSEAMYPHPFSVKFTSSGLEVDYPDKVVYPQTYGEADIATDHNADFEVGAPDFSPQDARVKKATDWGVDVEMAESQKKITTTLLHGSPYIYFIYDNVRPRIVARSSAQVFKDDGNALGVKINGRLYGFFAPTGSVWSGAGTGTFQCTMPDGRNYLTVAVLPSADAFDYFKARAYAFVEDTKVSWSYDRSSSKVTSTFTYTTVAKEGSNRDTIMALYPHQWRFNTSINPTSWTYSSVRGTMKVIAGTSFQVPTTYQGILPWFPDVGDYDRPTLSGLVDKVYREGVGNPPKYSTDVYWGGKYIGKLANLLPIAEQMNNEAAASEFKSIMKKAIEDWLTAGEGETGNLFFYDSNWGTLIGYKASYGEDSELNDHHFQFGYWVYGAAQLALRDREWASKWGPYVEKLIADYANGDRTNEMFPFLRNFDPYEGHSWASGHAKFFHGNNQESSSEAMNSSAAIILWGEATGNTALRDLGVYLYSTEARAIQNYWFDIYGDVFDEQYPSIEASMIWGGKIVHTTWWTDDPIQVHGINCLPLCAHSLYLGYDPEYPQKNYDAMLSEYALRGSGPQLWNDIMAMFLAYSNPQQALNVWNTSMSSEDGESAAHTLHYIYSLKALGRVDTSVTADTPLYGVFRKNGVKSYVAYNAGDTQAEVHFSDSHTMKVAPNSIGVDSSSASAPDAPVLLQANAGNGSVDLSWSPAENASGYRLKYAGSFGQKVVDVGMVTKYSVTGLENGTDYSFSVSAYNDKGESPDSNILTSTPHPVPTPTPTTSVTPTPTPTPTVVNDYSQGASVLSTSSLTLWFSGAVSWVDVHYRVNGGLQQNFRMTSGNSRWEKDIAGLNSGDTVTYWFTYCDNTLAHDTGAFSYTFASSPSSPTPTPTPSVTPTPTPTPTVVSDYSQGASALSSSSLTIWFSGAISWVDVHYRVNGGSQQNFRMTYLSSRWENNIAGLSSGDTVTYWFTYCKNTLAYDTGVFSCTFAGSPSSPTPTPTVEPTPTPTPTPTVVSEYSQGASALSPFSLIIWFSGAISWVDVHYRINGGIEQNFRMTYLSSRWEKSIAALTPGDRITYWFTYEKNSLAYDTGVFTYTLNY